MNLNEKDNFDVLVAQAACSDFPGLGGVRGGGPG